MYVKASGGGELSLSPHKLKIKLAETMQAHRKKNATDNFLRTQKNPLQQNLTAALRATTDCDPQLKLRHSKVDSLTIPPAPEQQPRNQIIRISQIR